MKSKVMLLAALAVAGVVATGVSASAVNWTQIGDPSTTQYVTPNPGWEYTAPAFSAVGDMPIELAVAGGVVPDFKITYGLGLLWNDYWGPSYGGMSGLALYVGDTPSTTGGLYTGVNVQRDSSWYVAGAIAGNATNAAGSADHYTFAGDWPGFSVGVTVEKIGDTLTTTITGMDNRVYSVTTADASNWTGATKFAAFRAPDGNGWSRGQVGVYDLTFYVASPEVTPEPSSLLLIGMGAVGLAARIRARRTR